MAASNERGVKVAARCGDHATAHMFRLQLQIQKLYEPVMQSTWAKRLDHHSTPA
jgi:hypothetical protein